MLNQIQEIKYYVRLRNYCLEIAGLMAWRASGIDREELAQTALTRIIRAGDCGNYDPSQSSPSTYIKTIVRRTCISMLRAKKQELILNIWKIMPYQAQIGLPVT